MHVDDELTERVEDCQRGDLSDIGRPVGAAERAHAKREGRADATIGMSHDNNPLKFSPGLEAALTHLLVPRGQGFMPPLRSLADARESLRTHQDGFVAGMRAALPYVDLFAPAHTLESLAALEPYLARL